MSGPFSGAGSNPPVGGSGASNPTANPPVGGQQGNQPPQSGNNGVPGSNPPVGGSGNNANQANQQQNQQNAGQQQQPEADNSPVSRDVYNERVRSEKALRQRVEQLETLQRQRDEAQLSESERKDRRLAEYEQKETAWQLERQNFYMDKAISDVAAEKNLASSSAVRAIMMAEFGHLIGYDDDTGRPNNIGYVVDQVVAKYPFLVQQQQQQQQVPGSGRPFSPPRPGGQPAQQNMQSPQQQFVPPQEWKKLSDLTADDWARNNRNNNPNNNNR